MEKVKQEFGNKNKQNQDWFQLDDRKSYLIIALLCFMCYGNTIFNNYSLDDDLNVTKNAYVQKGIAGIPDILTHPYAAWSEKSGDYRPMAAITYALENQFFNGNPHVSHLFSIIYFILCVCFLYKVLNEVFALQKIHFVLPLVIAAFFAVHPIHTEVVSSVKNREEILSLAFGLLSLLYAHRFLMAQKEVKLALATLLFFVLAVVSKVTIMPMIGVFLLMAFYYRLPKGNINYVIFSSFMIVLAIGYFALMWYFVKRQFYDLENPLVFNHDPSVKLGTSMATLWFYFKMMFYPHPLSFYYGFNTIPLISFNSPISSLSFLIHLVLFGYGVWSFFQKRIAGFFIISYFMCIFPYSNIAVIYTGIVSERAFFFPGMWLLSAFIVIIFLFMKFGRDDDGMSIFHKPVIVAGLVLFVMFSWLTIQRNFQWKDTMTLMSTDIEHLQNSTLANFFYGTLLQETGERTKDSSGVKYIELAKKYYRHALAISPGYSEPYYKLGMIYEYDEGNNDSAFTCFKMAHRMDTALLPAEFQLAKIYSMYGNYASANPLFEKVYKKIPGDTFNLFFYAQSLYFVGDSLKAYSINNSLLALAPGDYHPYLNRGMFSKLKGNTLAAESDLEKVLQLGYQGKSVINALGECYTMLGQTEKAEALLKYRESVYNNTK